MHVDPPPFRIPFPRFSQCERNTLPLMKVKQALLLFLNWQTKSAPVQMDLTPQALTLPLRPRLSSFSLPMGKCCEWRLTIPRGKLYVGSFRLPFCVLANAHGQWRQRSPQEPRIWNGNPMEMRGFRLGRPCTSPGLIVIDRGPLSRAGSALQCRIHSLGIIVGVGVLGCSEL